MNFTITPPPITLLPSQHALLQSFTDAPQNLVSVLGTHRENELVRELEGTLENWLDTGVLVNKKSFTSGRVFGVALSSASTALTLALESLNLPSEAEVLTTGYGWPDSVAPMIQAGLTTVCVDIDDAGSPSLADLEAAVTPQTAAVLAVAPHGYLPDLPALQQFCQEHGLTLILDAAQAIGTAWKNSDGLQGLCDYADIVVVSFGGKLLNAGQGGFLGTRHRDVYEYAMRYSQHPARQSLHLQSVNPFPGNFRIHGLAAALAVAGVPDIADEILLRRANLAALTKSLRGVDFITPLNIIEGAQANGSTGVFHCEVPEDVNLINLYLALRRRGLPLSMNPAFDLLDEYEYPEGQFRCESDLKVSRYWGKFSLIVAPWLLAVPAEHWLDDFCEVLSDALHQVWQNS